RHHIPRNTIPIEVVIVSSGIPHQSHKMRDDCGTSTLLHRCPAINAPLLQGLAGIDRFGLTIETTETGTVQLRAVAVDRNSERLGGSKGLAALVLCSFEKLACHLLVGRYANLNDPAGDFAGSMRTLGGGRRDIVDICRCVT